MVCRVQFEWYNEVRHDHDLYVLCLQADARRSHDIMPAFRGLQASYTFPVG
jgi:hypothetical protein